MHTDTSNTSGGSILGTGQSKVGSRLAPLTLGALGVVYGDIGTSPLYTIRECFGAGRGAIAVDPANVLGFLSLIFWSLFFVVTLKYVFVVMRADNKGEGGEMALMALTLRAVEKQPGLRSVIILLAMVGASLFYGDGMITPAISVLSAVEGMEFVTPVFKPYVVPLAVAILLALFIFQSRGTAGIGRLFGPVMCAWFAVLAALGIAQIAAVPYVLKAIDPGYAVDFAAHHKFHAFAALGAVVLAFTGAEALYTDMGHFGKKPIRYAWFGFVLPALVLNYFGQGALLIANPETVRNPFFLLAPQGGLLALVILSTVATVIASQAVISGAFSLTNQAIQLGYCPRLEVRHTSEREIGQIYIPQINWSLMVAVLVLVLGFKSSSNLAAAYGVAVTGAMSMTTILAGILAIVAWRWNWMLAVVVFGFFLIVDLAFFGANLLKLIEGGWFPLLIGGVTYFLMATWKRGRAILLSRLRDDALSIETFLSTITDERPHRVAGTAVYMTGNRDVVPGALLHNLKHNKVLHDRVVLLTVVTEDTPTVAPERRLEIQPLQKRFYRATVRYGFNEFPDLPRALQQSPLSELTFNAMETSYFLGRETLMPGKQPAMAKWREWIFIALSRNALSATDFFRIPTNRVVELGTQIEL